MKRKSIFRRMVAVSAVWCLLCITGFYESAYGESVEVSDEAIIEAFKSNPTISEKISKYQKDGFEDEGLSITVVGETCNETGCRQRFLVAQSYAKNDGYRKMENILGVVDVSAKGEITGVAPVNMPLTIVKADKPQPLMPAEPIQNPDRVLRPVKPTKAVPVEKPIKLKRNSNN